MITKEHRYFVFNRVLDRLTKRATFPEVGVGLREFLAVIMPWSAIPAVAEVLLDGILYVWTNLIHGGKCVVSW